MNELFLKIINMSLSASWLVLVVLILRLVMKKAPRWVNVLLWGIVAIRLICPFTIESSISMIPDSVGNGEWVSEWMDDYIGDIDIHHPDSVYYDAAIAAGREPISDGEGGYYVVTKHDQLGEPATIENTVLPVLSAVWVVGMAVLILYTVISCSRLRRKLDTAVRYKDNIYQSENVSSPFVLGIFKPRIYLPFKLDGQDREHVVAHERAHIRRKDHWWKPLGFLLLTIHWFNPLMWLAYVLLCRDIELACDEKVIQALGNEQRADYTQALVACSVGRRRIAACPLAFGEVGVMERVRSVMNYKKPAFWMIILAVIACMVVAVCFLTNPKQDSYTLRTVVPAESTPESIPSDESNTNFKTTSNTMAGRTLTQEEMDRVNETFSPMLYDKQGNPMGTNIWSCFFTSYYSDVRDLNFEEFLKYFPGDGSEVNEEEFAILKAQKDFLFYGEVLSLDDMPVPVHRYPVRLINLVLTEYAGITVDDLDTSEVNYLSEYDAYYNYTSDFEPGMFTCTRGEIDGDIVRLYEEDDDGTDVLILKKVENGYQIVSHQKV